MARKKPNQVKEVRNERLGIVIPIFLDPNNLEFYASFNGEYYRDTQAARVEGLLHTAIRNSINIVWHPVIAVQTLKVHGMGQGWTNDQRSFVGLDLNRYYVGKRPDGTWAKVDWRDMEPPSYWDGTDEEREAKSWILSQMHSWGLVAKNEPLVLPIQTTRFLDGFVGESMTILAFSEAMWAGLTALVANIQRAREQLHEMITTPEGQERLLVAGSQPLLAPPEEEPV